MPRDRFFIEGVHAAAARVIFASDDAHKIATVLRMRTGDRVVAVDSSGTAYEAVLEVDGRDVAATLGGPVAAPDPEPGLAITIAQAVPKGQKMELVVEKTTELGVAAIVPVRSARVVAHDVSPAKLERWRRVARSAAQQSGRARIPDVRDVAEWPALLATFPQYDRIYIPWEVAERVPLRDVLESDLAGAASVLVVIGPEGGFAAHEVESAVAAGARTVSLGARILRTETAALAVVAVLRYVAGEM